MPTKAQKSLRFKRFKDIVKRATSPRAFTVVFVFVFAILMAVFPDYYLTSTRRGLALFSTTVLPSLFPFYFCSILLTKIGAAKTLSIIFEKPMTKLYHAPKESAYIMFLSMLSGYPIGAACIKELYLASAISSDDAKLIASFASTSGPIFMLGTVGSAIFNNLWIGVIVLVSHYISAFLNGFLYKRRHSKPSSPHIVSTFDAHSDNILSESVAKSTLQMLTLGGYIVLGGLIVDTLAFWGVDKFLTKLFADKSQPAISIVFGLVEMTRGVVECSKCTYIPIGVATASMLVSFGGLSIAFQSHAFLSVCGMKISEILLRKTTQAAISFVLAFLLSLAFQKLL